jgi:hypothetical protein
MQGRSGQEVAPRIRSIKQRLEREFGIPEPVNIGIVALRIGEQDRAFGEPLSGVKKRANVFYTFEGMICNSLETGNYFVDQ